MCSIEALKRENKKNKSLQEELKEKEGSHNSNFEEVEQIIVKLKNKVEEDKRIKDVL